MPLAPSMIYFEFTISRHTHVDESDFSLPTAEFMFDSDNPAQCTRQAALLLRMRGWRPVSVKQACEGFALEDFHLGGQVGPLFREAQVAGIGFSMHEKDEPIEKETAGLISQEMV